MGNTIEVHLTIDGELTSEIIDGPTITFTQDDLFVHIHNGYSQYDYARKSVRKIEVKLS